jgi:molybdate transport system substrate-binding protein
VGALQNALRPLIADFAKTSGDQVKLMVTGPAALDKTLAEGNFDVITAAAPAIDGLEKAGKVASGTPLTLGRVGIGVAVREGAAKPDLATPEAFKRAIMAARNIVYTDPAVPNASGVVTMRILAAAGLVDTVKDKSRQEALGPARDLIAKGEYELGIFNVSEAEAPGVVLAGPVPAPLQQYTIYAAAMMSNAATKDRAADFVNFVTGKDAALRWRAGGVEAM